MVANIDVLFSVLLSIRTILGANILYVTPSPSPSHHVWNMVLALGLVEKGHNLTMLTHQEEKEFLPQNFTLITMTGLYEILEQLYDIEKIVEDESSDILTSFAPYYEMILIACEHDYNTSGFNHLWNYPADFKFDVILFDASLGRCYYPLIERFRNSPSIAVTPFLLPPVLSTVFGNHFHTSYVPYYSTGYSNKMSLMERIVNFIYTNSEWAYRNYIHIPVEVDLVKRYFKDQAFSLDELERNISLLFCNVDPILEYPFALPPNIIPLGGLNAKGASTLPDDLQEIMDKAKHGVILFSLGTNVQSDKLDLKTRDAFLDAFGKLRQVVLWKFESDDIEDLPKNVIIRKWLPQNDILGHPNTKLFITHGGALSTHEAIYHSVPIIGIPFFVDQHINVRKIKDKQIGIYLDRRQLKSQMIYEATEEMLNSQIYRNNMAALSRLYHDQPQTALERGIFWTEYVLRHGSAEQLVPAARDMPGYQTTNLDVAAVIVFALILVYLMLVFILTRCPSVILGRLSKAKVKIT